MVIYGICRSCETILPLDGALQGSGAFGCCRTHCVHTPYSKHSVSTNAFCILWLVFIQLLSSIPFALIVGLTDGNFISLIASVEVGVA
jgi:hypothetical protein